MYRSSPMHCWFMKPAEAVDELYNYSKPICEEERRLLLSMGISDRAIKGDQWNPIAGIFSSFVDFNDEFFIFNKNGEPAFILAEMDSSGCVVDFIAFTLDGRFSTSRKIASLLGTNSIYDPRIAREQWEIFPNPIDWLRGDRAGVVVLDPNKARWDLSEYSLFCADNQYALEISKKLCLPVPCVFTEIDQ
jgi:hypothetical protein